MYFLYNDYFLYFFGVFDWFLWGLLTAHVIIKRCNRRYQRNSSSERKSKERNTSWRRCRWWVSSFVRPFQFIVRKTIRWSNCIFLTWLLLKEVPDFGNNINRFRRRNRGQSTSDLYVLVVILESSHQYLHICRSLICNFSKFLWIDLVFDQNSIDDDKTASIYADCILINMLIGYLLPRNTSENTF